MPEQAPSSDQPSRPVSEREKELRGEIAEANARILQLERVNREQREVIADAHAALTMKGAPARGTLLGRIRHLPALKREADVAVVGAVAEDDSHDTSMSCAGARDDTKPLLAYGELATRLTAYSPPSPARAKAHADAREALDTFAHSLRSITRLATNPDTSEVIRPRFPLIAAAVSVFITKTVPLLPTPSEDAAAVAVTLNRVRMAANNAAGAAPTGSPQFNLTCWYGAMYERLRDLDSALHAAITTDPIYAANESK